MHIEASNLPDAPERCPINAGKVIPISTGKKSSKSHWYYIFKKNNTFPHPSILRRSGPQLK
jgi:hypothetical protein